MRSVLPFTSQTFERHMQYWEESLLRGEVCTVLFAPMMGRPNRLANIQERMEESGNKMVILEFPKLETTSFDQVESIFNDPSVSSVGVLYADQTLIPTYSILLEKILYLQVSTQKGLLFFFDAMPYQIEQSYVSQYTQLFQNTDYFPLLSRADTEQFIRYLSNKWSFQLSNEIIQDIIKHTIGQPWLTKEIVRQLVKGENISTAINSEIYIFKMRSLWNTLDEQAKVYLRQLYLTKKSSENEIGESLKTMGYISDSFEESLPPYVITMIESEPAHQIIRFNHDILLDSKRITHHFTKLEKRFLLKLLENPTSISSRQSIANTCWDLDDSGSYSDWALDQIVKRVRKKIASLGVSPLVIKTHKEKGFSMVYEK